MPGKVYNVLLDLALDQYGYLTPTDARDVGVDPRRLVEMARRGTLERVDHGLYRLPAVAHTALDQLMLATLWPRKLGVLSHETALDLHDLCDVNPAKVHITVPASYRLARDLPAAYVLHRRDLEADDVTHHEGIALVTPLRAILDGVETRLRDGLIDQAIATATERGLLSRDDVQRVRRARQTPKQ